MFFSAADTLSFTAAGTAQITMADGVVAPVTDDDVDMGTASLEFKDGYFDGTLYCDVLNLAGTDHTSISGGAWTLLATFTSDGSDDTASFTSGLDSTYDEYCFRFIDIHPETDNQAFTFNFSIDSGSNYNVQKLSSAFVSESLDGASYGVQYEAGQDLASSTAFQPIHSESGNDADQAFSGYMHVWGVSGTTFMKSFMAKCVGDSYNNYSRTNFTEGRAETTSAINAIQFKYASGEIQAGKIKLYGIS